MAQGDPKHPDRYDSELRSRLQHICDGLSQSEVARRTGTSPNNISRYLRGAKIPLDLGTALTQELGVNPVWLLTGEGQPYLSEISIEAENTASRLLELVQVMTNINKARLGAFAHPSRGKIIDELLHMLDSFENARDALTKHTRPVYASLLKNLQSSLENNENDRSSFLVSAIEQISRLCDDDELENTMLQLLAAYKRQNLLFFEYIDINRRVFSRLLRKGCEIGPHDLNLVQEFVISLLNTYYLDEGIGFARAVLALTRKSDSKERKALALICGLLEAECGELECGIKRIRTSYTSMGMHERKTYTRAHIRAQLYSGALTLDECLRMRPEGPGVGRTVLHFANWMENKRLLERAFNHYFPDQSRLSPIDMPVFIRSKYALQGLSSKNPQLVRLMEEEFDNLARTGMAPPPQQAFYMSVIVTQLLRITGDRSGARKKLRSTHEKLSSLPDGTTPLMLDRATHFRNAIELTSENDRVADLRLIRKEAFNFYQQHIDKGYSVFNIVLNESSVSL